MPSDTNSTPARIPPLRVTAWTATTAAGRGRAALGAALRDGRSALTPNDFGPTPLATWIGRVAGLEDLSLPPSLASWDCRNNRLAWLGLQQDGLLDAVHAARERLGAGRIAVVLGTSTSSIGATEDAYRALEPDGRFPAGNREAKVHTPNSLVAFVAEALTLEGPALTVSTACSSSAKVFASAERLIRLGVCDAALVGGVDTLCGSVLFGFHALQLVSPEPCRPFDAARSGISLGEAAGFALLERDDPADRTAMRLVGWGESSDAHHMSTPHPEGLGAERALDDALARAGLGTDAVDHVNLHGTASTKNDEVEAALVARRFPERTHAASTKGVTGHTLGAAGIVEAVAAMLAIESGWMPGSVGARTLDPLCGPQVKREGAAGDVRIAASSSFGFGGNNGVLVFARADAVRPLVSPASAGPRALEVAIEGIAFWSPTRTAWTSAREAFLDDAAAGPPLDPPAKRPAPELLPPAERRRAPDSVAVALEVASAAVAASGRDPATLPSLFASTHGDLAINDSMCATLATAPTTISPTKFHNSVHNAAAGYWTIGTRCHAASSAITAGDATFGAGLLEAMAQCVAEDRPVLLVAFDVQAVGPLATVTRSDGLLACALVLAPAGQARADAVRLEASLDSRPAPVSAPRTATARALAGNAMAGALPALEALARGTPARLALPLGPRLTLQLRLDAPALAEAA